jgi:hypothetical protein
MPYTARADAAIIATAELLVYYYTKRQETGNHQSNIYIIE